MNKQQSFNLTTEQMDVVIHKLRTSKVSELMTQAVTHQLVEKDEVESAVASGYWNDSKTSNLADAIDALNMMYENEFGYDFDRFISEIEKGYIHAFYFENLGFQITYFNYSFTDIRCLTPNQLKYYIVSFTVPNDSEEYYSCISSLRFPSFVKDVESGKYVLETFNLENSYDDINKALAVSNNSQF